MKNRIISILIGIFLVAGIGLLLYPTIGEYINSRKSSQAISMYNEVYQNTEKDLRQNMLLEAEQYNSRLCGAADPLINTTSVPGYNKLLDLTGTGIMGYIDIDKIGVELPIYHGVDNGVLQLGIGHLEGSSLPVGGENTHCVLSGHRGLPNAKLFTDLDELKAGDTFTLTVLDRVMTYEVDQVKIVLPEETDDLLIEQGKDYCTLVTCTPYGINTHRLLVRGVRVDGDEHKAPGIFVSNEALRIDTIIVSTAIAVPLFVLVVVITMIVTRRLNRHEKNKKT